MENEKIEELKEKLKREMTRYHNRNNFYRFLRSGCRSNSSLLNNNKSNFIEPISDNTSGATSGKGRNKKCCCGSDLKYKKCCLLKQIENASIRAESKKEKVNDE